MLNWKLCADDHEDLSGRFIRLMRLTFCLARHRVRLTQQEVSQNVPFI